MESVARRVAGVATVTSFPRKSREGAPWPEYEDVPAAAGSRSTAGAAAAAAGAADAAPGAGTRRALCIGVDAYPDEGDRLKGCVADERAWADALRAAKFEVTELTDAAATRDAILRGILELVSQAAPGDVLAVQYSGHGTFVPDLDADEDDGDVAKDEALCPVDFRKQGRLIIDDDLARIWDVIPEGVALTAFFDSCHSGSANRAPRVDLTPVGDSLPRAVVLTREDEEAYRADRGVAPVSDEADPVRDAAIASVLASEVVAPAAPRAAGVRREVLFSACKATEVAWESGGHGDFTRTAIPLLTTGVGSVSNRDFVRQVVEQFGPNRRQTPEFHGEEVLGGRILLGTASASAVAGDGAGTVGTGAVTPVGPGTRTDDGVASDRQRDAVVAILRATADLLEA
jgi:hypothetical protein